MHSLFITADGSHSIASSTFDENYHSTHGAIDESNHVFIQEGLNFWLKNNANSSVNILEIGLGTCLNAFLTIIESEKQNLRIHYTGVEAYPIDEILWQQLNYPEILNSSKELFKDLHIQSATENFMDLSAHFLFKKIIAPAEKINYIDKYDIIFFDAFAPVSQPELWEISFLQKMYDCLNPNGILVTYCAKGSFKRALKAVGFEIENPKGSTGKREMTRGIKR